MLKKPRYSLAVVVSILGAFWLLRAGPEVAADSGTPTALATLPAPTPSPEPSIIIATPEPTTAELPTVAAERSTPVVTVAPQVTATPFTSPTPPPQLETTPHVKPQVTPRPTPSPVPVQAPASPGGAPLVAPLPSPAQLQLDARLRWGDTVPASVRRWAFLIVPAAREYGLNPNLVAAVMTMESDGDPLAWNSTSDARGLMQVLHGPWDPKKNVYTGCRILSAYLAQFGDLKLALAAYDAGPNAVITYGGVPPYRETHDYVIVVSYLYDLFSHRTLTLQRRTQYRATLRDLAHFKDQRKKIARLAEAAHVAIEPALLCRHIQDACSQPDTSPIFATLDPFWPLAGAPDPLQQVKLSGQ